MAERILVCDDEAHILHAVAFKLKAGGYEIVTANNGREAIEWLEANTPDFVITDCQMPHVDGIGLCRYLRGRPQTATVPVVMLTAKALELSEQLVKHELGIDTVMMKPFSPRALLETVRTALKPRPTASAATP
jgi:DNA-binding response OmpR family regulator